jgi:uncharacterized protein YtpQ (UPF0354 family)
MSAASREQFIAQVQKVIAERFPLVKAEPHPDAFALRVNGHLASLENVYRLATLQPEETKHHVERWVVELLRAAEGTPDETAPFDEVKERILPMILSESTSDMQTGSMVTEPFVGDLVLAYALDNDRTIAYIPKRHFDDWKITLDALHETALGNLVTRSEAINAQAAQDEEGKISLILFRTMDGYDASRILLPTLHERLREHLGSPFAAAIPNRDILICFRNDDQTVDRLRPQIKDDFDTMPHQVTDKVLLVTADGIALRD